jgi:transcriptional regulator GlxA family with amidase domain
VTKVVFLLVPGVHLLDLAGPAQAFGTAADLGCGYELAYVAGQEDVPTAQGVTVKAATCWPALARGDLVIVPGWRVGPAIAGSGPLDDEALEALAAHHARGGTVASVCAGADALGRAGLLDGRRCTTHWMHAGELAARYPEADVDPDVLFVCDGPVFTSAGTAAGLDLCLHVIRADHGEEIARKVARRMIMPPHREGGQSQYVDAPIRTRPADTLAPLLDELLDSLAEEHTIESLSARAAMSPRTFARRFRQETGTTPHLWLTSQRILLARRMLESGDDAIELIADRSGFTNAAMLRHHFTRVVGTPPSAYRRQFCGRVAS